MLGGGLAVRFLGVEAPESSLPLPGTMAPRFDLADVRWEQFLTDPFSLDFPPINPPLDPGLQDYIASRVRPPTALSYVEAAHQASMAFNSMVNRDLFALSIGYDEFECFIVFAHEVMDRYGRLLGYWHPAQRDTPREERLLSYNERLLKEGWVSPYFIWPNINPFRAAPVITAAVPKPRTARQLADQDVKLRNARRWVKEARDRQIGLYERDTAPGLLPFELRFLNRRQPPDRWVIDLSQNDHVLIPPQAYFKVTNPEDRLFVPAEYVPLFVEAGWQRGESSP